MESVKERIEQILEKAESELRAVIAESAHTGDYRNVDMGRAAAVGVREVLERVSQGKGSVKAKHKREEVEKEGRRRKLAKRKKRKRSGYPKFEIRNGSLIKVGWSKKQGTEYSHKVPMTVFDETVKAMSALSASEAGPFPAEAVIERVNRTQDEIVPAYQVYVTIAFLREKNCVGQVGREGYTIPLDLKQKAKNVWARLEAVK